MLKHIVTHCRFLSWHTHGGWYTHSCICSTSAFSHIQTKPIRRSETLPKAAAISENGNTHDQYNNIRAPHVTRHWLSRGSIYSSIFIFSSGLYMYILQMLSILFHRVETNRTSVERERETVKGIIMTYISSYKSRVGMLIFVYNRVVSQWREEDRSPIYFNEAFFRTAPHLSVNTMLTLLLHLVEMHDGWNRP